MSAFRLFDCRFSQPGEGPQPLPIIKVPSLPVVVWFVSCRFLVPPVNSIWAPLLSLYIRSFTRGCNKVWVGNKSQSHAERTQNIHRQIWHFFSLLYQRTGEWFYIDEDYQEQEGVVQSNTTFDRNRVAFAFWVIRNQWLLYLLWLELEHMQREISLSDSFFFLFLFVS